RLIARSDHDIQADLERRLEEEIQVLQRLAMSVAGGVVTIDAAAGPLARQVLQGLARTVPGVVEVRLTQRGAEGAEPPRGTNADRERPDGAAARPRYRRRAALAAVRP